jgi:hypothetical protein
VIKIEKKMVVKLFFYYGTILDGIMAVIMVLSLFTLPPIIIPYFETTNVFRFTMGWAAVFMIAWTLLLFWASFKPIERIDVIPLTLYILVLGLAIISAYVGLTNISLFQVLGIILPGSIIYFWMKILMKKDKK